MKPQLSENLDVCSAFGVLCNASPEGSRLGSRLQLMKQPQGMWIQRSDSTKSGVTAGASRVRKKHRVSRDELRAFSAWRTSTEVCE